MSEKKVVGQGILVDFLAEDQGMTKAQASRVIASLTGFLRDCLLEGDVVRLSDLGTFDVVESAARTGRNPATGEQIDIPAKRKIRFRASASVKARLA
ncbi:HU family DNA-binding protein [Acidithiobacillus sp. IBUN Pt1247-S3]|uniref:HU family DNA-binding protein n=1 Tax=Acidithiobacillus sp. IBUN Pt1247-S3 TaxID=3166642 RepID=UPI0034E5A964